MVGRRAPTRSYGRGWRAAAAVVFMLAVTGWYAPSGNSLSWPLGPALAHSQAGDAAPDVLRSVPNFPDPRDPT